MYTFITRTGWLIVLLFSTGFISAQTLTLPPGFTQTIIAEGLGGARHMAVNKQGGVYVKLSRLKDGKGIIYLKDTKKDGKYSQQLAFGDYPGTGIFIRGNYLYASSNDAVFRYLLNNNGEPVNPNAPEKIISGLVDHKRDNSKSIAVDNNNNIYVNVGSYANACLIDPKSKVAPNPCPLLDSVAGIWQFKTNKLNQQYKDAVHYAVGFKNVVGLDWNSQTNSLFIIQHGRGDLHNLFPELYSVEQDAKLPAETMYEVRKGADGGWPYEYYDPFLKKQIMAPEYGGDGKKAGTHKALNPVAVFPAHFGPNGMLFYTGNKFPAKYRNGAFVAFHGKGSDADKGWNVGFVPFVNGKPAAKYEVFADNFSINKDQRKPCGIAQSADGAIFISDDSSGSIYRIQYTPNP